MTLDRKTLIAGAFGAAVALGAAIGVAVADQPAMHYALTNLRQARHNLDNATHDKGCHREAAIGHLDQAIHEVEEASASIAVTNSKSLVWPAGDSRPSES